MATYKQIQDWVKKQYGFVPKTCWIADVKPSPDCPCAKHRIERVWIASIPAQRKRLSQFVQRYAILGKLSLPNP